MSPPALTLEGRKMLTIFNGMSPALNRSPRQRVAVRIATALHAAETKAHFRGDPRRAPADAAFLSELAERLAVAAHLPIELAQRRVTQLAISARPPRDGGFQDRSR
jgi:hypothetical protein